MKSGEVGDQLAVRGTEYVPHALRVVDRPVGAARPGVLVGPAVATERAHPRWALEARSVRVPVAEHEEVRVPVALVAAPLALVEVRDIGDAGVAFDRSVGSRNVVSGSITGHAHHLGGAPVGRVLGSCSIPIEAGTPRSVSASLRTTSPSQFDSSLRLTSVRDRAAR